MLFLQCTQAHGEYFVPVSTLCFFNTVGRKIFCLKHPPPIKNPCHTSSTKQYSAWRMPMHSFVYFRLRWVKSLKMGFWDSCNRLWRLQGIRLSVIICMVVLHLFISSIFSWQSDPQIIDTIWIKQWSASCKNWFSGHSLWKELNGLHCPCTQTLTKNQEICMSSFQQGKYCGSKFRG